ncbi:hypothetical protein GCM10009525_53670 [Streptosporangium amethystogenes subsp. fukuiense]
MNIREIVPLPFPQGYFEEFKKSPSTGKQAKAMTMPSRPPLLREFIDIPEGMSAP